MCEEILPRLIERSDEDIRVTIAGTMLESVRRKCAAAGCDVLGAVDDLQPVYRQPRVFLAPTRFSAGVPLKLIEAAAQGIPIVATSLLAGQLGWRNEYELLVADAAADIAECCVRLHQDELLWKKLSDNALAAVRRSYARDTFVNGLRELLGWQNPTSLPTAEQQAA